MLTVLDRQKLLASGLLLSLVSIFQLSLDAPVTVAQEKIDLAATALSVAPRDVAFFATSINMRKSWDGFLNGGLVTRLRGLRYIRSLEAEFARQWENPQGQLEQFRRALENPNVRNLLNLASEMISHESFVYGEDDWCDTIEGIVDFQNQIVSVIRQDPEGLVEFLKSLEREDVARLRIPTTVIGFRLSNDQNARLQLDALEGILRLAGGQIAELKPFLDKVRRLDFSDGQTLTLSFDTSMIPLDRIGENERETVESIVELLDGRSLYLSLGVKANVLLFVVGEGDSAIDSVGEAASKLLDHPPLDLLKQAELTDLRSVSFASKRWRESQWKASFNSYFQNLSAQFSVALAGAADEIPDAQKWKDDILRDAQTMDEQLRELTPEFGDMLAWGRATNAGFEGWTYDWSESSVFENASPMHILNHAGTSSLLLIAVKQKEIPQAAELVQFALDKAPGHIRRFITSAENDPQQREQALDIFDRAWPLIDEAFEILRYKIGPALESKETLFSIAGAWTTTDLGPSLPRSTEPLPLPEIAVACKLDNRELLLEGCADLYRLFDQSVEIVRAVNPDAVPANYSVPRPEQVQVGTATIFSYPELSRAVPLPGFKPQVVVTDDTLVLGYSDRQVLDMLEAKPLATRPAWLKDESPVAMVSYVDFAGMVEAAQPWVKYGIGMTGLSLDDPFGPAPLVPTGNVLLQIWDCLSALGKAAGTATVTDSGPTISRWVWVSE